MPLDFQGQRLLGQNFKGQNLRGADFRGADLRSANFTGAVLTRANFSGIKAGLSLPWLGMIGLVMTVLSFLGAMIIAYASGFIGSPPFQENFVIGYVISRCVALLLFGTFVVVTLLSGLGHSLGVLLVTVAAIIAIMLALPGIDDTRGEIWVQSVAIAIESAGIIVSALALTLAQVIGGKFGISLFGVMSGFGLVLGFVAGFSDPQLTENWGFLVGLAIPLVSLAIATSLYIGYQAIAESPKFTLIRQMAIALGSFGGTRFCGADLTDADFSRAVVPNTDFRNAIITRTCWHQVKLIRKARVGASYLSDRKICQLVVSKHGQAQNFDDMNLQGVNLAEADVAESSFISTKLMAASFENADLTGTKLVRAQLYAANLSGACLTGAYIEDWGISTDTVLDQVRCKYIYMRLPTADDPDACRKPDNRDESFSDGDFTDFIAPIIKTLDLYRTQNIDPRAFAQTFKTLDLYHHEGIDPSAVAIAFNQLAKEHPEAELELVALEGRGDEKIRLQAKVTGSSDRSALSAAYFDQYQSIKALPYADLQSLLAGIAEKDDRIRSLEKIVETALGNNQRFYVETYYNVGDTVSEKSSINIQAGGDIGNVSGIAGRDINGVINLGTISGSVTNAINQLPDQSSASQPSLKELLTQLQAFIEAEAGLPVEDKAEALEQVKTLAEAGQKPEDSGLQKAAKTAMKILKGTVSGLSETTKLIGECAKLLPAIATLLALV